jgi:hypothetical protein
MYLIKFKILNENEFIIDNELQSLASKVTIYVHVF